jgi:hypothetical protein
MKGLNLKNVFLAMIALTALLGSLANLFRLLEHFYLWPLVRFAGYTALLASTLLMLRNPRYNVPQ